MSDDTSKHLNNVVPIDEQELQGHLNKVVLKTVEDTRNQILDAEADALVGADRYERTETRKDYRSGSYTRKRHTRAGELELKMPKLCKQTETSNNADSGWVLTRAPVVVTRIAGVKVKIGGI